MASEQITAVLDLPCGLQRFPPRPRDAIAAAATAAVLRTDLLPSPSPPPPPESRRLELCETAHARTSTIRVDRLLRLDEWRRAKSSALSVVIGARVTDADVQELIQKATEPHRAAFLRDMRARALHPPTTRSNNGV